MLLRFSPPLFPTLSTLRWLMAALILVVLPHLPRLAWWVGPTFLGLVLARYLITRYRWRLPGNVIQLIIAFLILAGVFLSYHTWFGRDAGVALLVALCGLKLLEMNNLRDALLLCFLSYFLIITNFLYSQTIPTAVYMAVVIIITTVALISLSDLQQSLSTRQRLRLATTLLVQALPVMFVLFILFPRVSGSFWSLPKDARSSVSGLSDSMSLGNISKLVLSEEIAFRVKFDQVIPPSYQRYWRGPVLWWTDGQQWRHGFEHRMMTHKVELQPLNKPVHYTVTLEPHNERWLFALELPQHTPSPGQWTLDYQILTPFTVRQRMRYSVNSYTEYKATTMAPQLRKLSLQLPKGYHLKTRALAQQWQHENPNPQALIQKALRYFHENDFVYTYEPPPLSGDLIDAFLFNSRQGFCEHYASAFTVLMRAAAVPTRIVTGYLGGTINPIDDYLVIRQYDAHAWTEVWLADQGWVRVDPTAAVAPERIQQGGEITQSSRFSPLGIELDRNATVVRVWQRFRDSWDALDNAWNQWILGYDTQQQRVLLQQLGFKNIDWRGLIIVLMIVMSVVLLIIAAWIFLYSAVDKRSDPAQKIYLRFCRKLAQQGLVRQPAEGPLAFAQRIKISRPELTQAVEEITHLYIQIRYRSQTELLMPLRKAVWGFRP